MSSFPIFVVSVRNGSERWSCGITLPIAVRTLRERGLRWCIVARMMRAINDAIRFELQSRGQQAKVAPAGEPDEGQGIACDRGQDRPRALTYQTNDGRRDFAGGDRIVFLENNRDLGVKNGMLGSVLAVEHDAIQVRLDGRSADRPNIVNIPINSYQSVDHGYATTIHKNQGATVDRAFVLASATMDRHLTYVVMTRHRDSYFVTLEDATGERHTTWCVDLARAPKDAASEIGTTIGLAAA